MALRRDLTQLTSTIADLLVVGGGVYGLCAAWEAARRGLSVILIERGDFGEATSSNSLHTMHGGLRYLQHLDLRRMRESIGERRFWLQAAPDLVSPLGFVLPTYGHGLRGPEAMQSALALNDLISADRNREVAATSRLPRGRRLSRLEAEHYFGPLRVVGNNGAALWYDGFSHSPERLMTSLRRAGAAEGARYVNYCPIEELSVQDGRVVGAWARDLLTDEMLPLRARYVLNAAGPWVDSVAQMAGRRSNQPLFRPSKAMNLVVPRIALEAAIGVQARRQGRESDAVLDKGSVTYFLMPWGNYTLIGTKHLHFQGNPDTLRVEARDVMDFLAEINPFLGPTPLRAEDVVAVKCGLLPEGGKAREGDVVLQKHGRIVDHAEEDGISGLMSVVGVKWTTARLVAQQAVQRICRSLNRPELVRAGGPRPDLTDRPVQGNPLVPDCRASEPALEQAAREEMAVHLSDGVIRRTDLWLSRHLSHAILQRAARSMAQPLGWSEQQIEAEIAATQSALERRQAWRERIVQLQKTG